MLLVRLKGPVSHVPSGTSSVPPPAALILATAALNPSVLLVWLSPLPPSHAIENTGVGIGVGHAELGPAALPPKLAREERAVEDRSALEADEASSNPQARKEHTHRIPVLSLPSVRSALWFSE